MKRYLLLLLTLLPLYTLGSNTFQVKNAAICYDKREALQVKRAIGDLQNDIIQVTGLNVPKNAKRQIIVGTYGKSPLIQKLIKQSIIKESDLKGKWESYVLAVTNEQVPRLSLRAATPAAPSTASTTCLSVWACRPGTGGLMCL